MAISRLEIRALHHFRKALGCCQYCTLLINTNHIDARLTLRDSMPQQHASSDVRDCQISQHPRMTVSTVSKGQLFVYEIAA